MLKNRRHPVKLIVSNYLDSFNVTKSLKKKKKVKLEANCAHL